MLTKEDRIQDFERHIATWDTQLTLEAQDSILRIAREAFSRGYDEGFADGVVKGQNYQGQVTDMVLGNIFGEVKR